MKLNDGKKKNKAPAHIKQTEKPSRVKKTKAPKAEKKAPAPKKKTKGSGKGKIGLIIVLVVLALIVACAAAGVIYISGIDRIYPNVSLDGIDLGDMSLTEAAAVLDEAGYASQEGKELNVHLPLDFVLNVKAEEVCTETPIAELVQKVYDACSGGSPISDAVNYIKCRFAGMSLTSEVLITADSEAIAAKVDNMVQELQLALLSSDVSIGEESISVIKGARGIILDSQEIVALVVEALEKGDYSDITYEAEIDTDQELDVEGLHSSVFCEAEEARYDKESGEIVDHVVGIDFDVEEAVELWNAAEYGETVEIPLIISEPELTAEKLDELLFRDVLSECETSLWGSTSNRINNVRLATEAVNGTVLLPGEEFDYNPTLGERTAANGYLPAGAYSGGQTVQEYGGGICQVSSMTYYCALYANLKITARTCHYFPVGYLPTGLDATVSWGGPEFRFVNDREYPIRIEAYMKDNNSGVVMKFIGTNVDGSYVKMGVGSWIVYDQTHTDVAVGYKASSTRSVYNADGSLRSQTSEALSHYHYHDEDIQWPEESPSPSPEEPTPSPEEVTPTPTPEEPAPTPEEPAPTPEEPAPTPEVTTPPPAETPVQPEETPAPPVEETPALPPAEESPADPPAEAP